MGALHKGHITLVEKARELADISVAYIFVNPTQFGPNEDFAKYPRTLENDQKLLSAAGCDLLYAPTVGEIYPEGFTAKIDPGPLANVLEGKFRPGHFAGVATVVAKMLNQVMPDVALFGEKDYQQLLIIRRIVRDLDIPVRIIGVPTVRDADGLALSSRNAYLTPDERRRASALPRVLNETAGKIQNGSVIADALKSGRENLLMAGFASVDYLELADTETLAPLDDLYAAARLLVAARMGITRLIDNISIDIGLEPK
jgi:pantoate--beta-alanine ligase